MRESNLPGPDDLVLVYEGSPPPDDLVASMVGRLQAEPNLDAVGAGQPVTDAVKVVDPESRVTSTLDRSRLVTLGTPAVVRRKAWEARQIAAIGLI